MKKQTPAVDNNNNIIMIILKKKKFRGTRFSSQEWQKIKFVSVESKLGAKSELVCIMLVIYSN